MKIFSLLFVIALFGKNCAGEKQDIQSALVEYTANTRGYYLNIIIENQKASISKDRNGKEKPQVKPISDADWKQLISSFQEIDLDGMADLKSPTEKRFYDGAAIANLKVTYKGKTYESAAFDHGNPPVEIEKLVTKINSFKTD